MDQLIKFYNPLNRVTYFLLTLDVTELILTDHRQRKLFYKYIKETPGMKANLFIFLMNSLEKIENFFPIYFKSDNLIFLIFYFYRTMNVLISL